MESLENKTREIMRKYGVVAEKKLGQNFLIDETAIDKIVESSNISNKDLIIEIGPGLGTLTERLIEKAGKVICIELDRRMISILENRFKEVDNIQIIYGDILKINLKELLQENNQFENIRVVANLPYYITTPIIMKLLEEKLNIDTITIMIQKEVADRIVAIPGTKDYGVLTINVGYKTDIEKVIDVPNSSFIPEPNVTSSVVRIMPNTAKMKALGIIDEKTFHKVIKLGFATRRKKFLNSLTLTTEIGVAKEDIKQIMDKLEINENVRAEELTIENIVNISNEIYNITKK